MIGAHPAMAMPTPAATAHHSAMTEPCGAMDQPAKPQPVSCIDCIMICSAIPTAETSVDAHPVASAPLPRLQLEQRISGLHPESEPPPPRFA